MKPLEMNYESRGHRIPQWKRQKKRLEAMIRQHPRSLRLKKENT